MELDDYIRNSEANLRQYKLQALKRWGQEKCSCGAPLETLFNTEGRNPIRICIKCEEAANNRDHYGDEP